MIDEPKGPVTHQVTCDVMRNSVTHPWTDHPLIAVIHRNPKWLTVGRELFKHVMSTCQIKLVKEPFARFIFCPSITTKREPLLENCFPPVQDSLSLTTSVATISLSAARRQLALFSRIVLT